MKKVKIKCDLCEGLIVDGRCVECGMYYQKYQGTYYLNERRPAHDTNKEAYESKSYEKSIEERRRQVEQKRAERLRREQEQQRQAGQSKQSQTRQTQSSQYQSKQNQTRQAQSSQYQSKQSQSRQTQSSQYQQKQTQSRQAQTAQTWSSQTGSRTYKNQQRTTTTSSARTDRTGKKNNKMGAIVSIIFIVIALAGEVLETVDFSTHESTIAPEWDSYDIVYEYEDDFEYSDDYEDENYDIYQFVTKEMPEDGEDYDIYLTNGNYVVGQQIPEGIYTAMMSAEPMMAVSGSWFTLEDEVNSIYKSWWFDEVEEQNGYYVIEDIRLYEGAKLEILAYGEVWLHTENGQLGDMQEPITNPMTQVFSLTDETTLVVGEDLEAGMYDAIWVSGDLILNISREDGYAYWYELCKEEDYECTSFCNIMLQEGDIVTLDVYSEEEGCVLLCSSPEIYE